MGDEITIVYPWTQLCSYLNSTDQVGCKAQPA